MEYSSTTSFDDLSQDTAANILLRLPALIRSTSVNKKWYSLITNPNFISAQIKHAISHCHHNAVLIVDSLDGLMLFTDLNAFYNSRHLYLWNPCVKTHRTLVSSCFKNLLDNIPKSYCISGLGFSEVGHDYRVVRIVYDMENKMNPPKVEVYSLRKQTWRKLKAPVVPRIGLADGVYVNGSFYWMETTPPEPRKDGRNCNRKDLWIMSFDFDNEMFGEVKVPKEVSKCLGTSAMSKLMEFEGSLALCVFDAQGTKGVLCHPYRIWLMRQENGVISWILRFTAALKKGAWPINITKRGTILMEALQKRFGVTSIISCNLKTMHYRDLGFGKPDGVEDPMLVAEPCSVDTSFTESLVMYEGGKSLLKFAK